MRKNRSRIAFDADPNLPVLSARRKSCELVIQPSAAINIITGPPPSFLDPPFTYRGLLSLNLLVTSSIHRSFSALSIPQLTPTMFASRPIAFSRTLLRFAASPAASHSPSSGAFAARLKKSTNITGIEVSSSPLSELEARYTKTLSLLTTLPENSLHS